MAITTIEGGDDLINAAEAAGGVTVSGTAEIGATLTVNGVPVTVDASGAWTTAVATAGEGPLLVTAVATDAAGNSTTATRDLTVDTLGPAVAITTIEGGDDLINAAEAAGGVTVSGTAEIGATLTVNGVPVTVDASGAWTTAVATAGEGLLVVTAVATDAAGNSTTATRDLTVDTLGPAVAITAIEGGDNLINAAEAAGGVTVSGTAEIGATLTVNGVPVTVDASGAWTTAVATAGEGLLVVTAVATDAAGNSTTATRDLTVDTLGPAVAITAIEGGDNLINAAEAAGGVTVSGTAEIGATLTVNGAPVTVDASGAWTTAVATAGEGLLVVTAVATDAAGNSTTATRDLTVDTLGPAAPTITSIPENGGGGIDASEASDGTPVVVGLTGTGAVAGDRLTINWGGQTVNYTLVAGDISGNSATVTVPLATITAQGQGTFNVTATLTDAAGNASSNSTATSVTVDSLGGGSGDVHMITFDGLHYDFQAVGDFVAAQSTDPGNAWQVQIRTGSWPGAVSITTELGALVGDDRVTFAIGRESLVHVDGVPDTVLRPGVTQTIAGGTLTEVSDDAYRLDLYGDESITVIDRGTYLDWTVALGPHDGPGSVRGLLGSNTGQTNDDFQLRDGTVLAQPLSEAEILSTFADAWTVAPGMSLLDETNVPAIGILAALALNVTDTLIGASGAATVHFTIGGLQVDDAGTVTFSDGTNHVTVNVSGAQINYTANLTTLNDGQITSVLAINTDPAGNSFTPVNGNAVVLDQDTGEQAALALTVNGGAPIGSTTAGAVPFTAVGFESDDNGSVSFSDGSHTPVVVNITNGVLAATTVNLAGLNDGTITATLLLNNDAAGNTSTNVVTTATLDQVKAAEAPGLTAPSALTVGAGKSIPLGIVITPVDADDVISVTVSGVPSFESVGAAGITPTITKQGTTFTYNVSGLPAANLNNGLILNSTYSGKGLPTNPLTVTVSNTTTGESATAPAKTISVTDPPAGNTISINGNNEVEIPGPSADNVIFAAGATGTLKLDGYAANSDNTGGMLSASDGPQIAKIALLGQYMASSFVTASDGGGGTLITDPPPNQQQLLTQPHA